MIRKSEYSKNPHGIRHCLEIAWHPMAAVSHGRCRSFLGWRKAVWIFLLEAEVFSRYVAFQFCILIENGYIRLFLCRAERHLLVDIPPRRLIHCKKKEMKKNVGCIVALLAVLAVVAVWFVKMYNGLVAKDEAVSSAWSQVENVYQRRMDLIPNLVNTVKGAAGFEQSTLQEVVAARAAATQVKVDPSQLSEENIARFQQAQDALGSSLSRLLVSVERYPDLKATQNFRDLQAQLEGTENRISVERQKFNTAVQSFNTAVRRFPRNIVAGMFGFEKKGYFEANEGAEAAPVVDFGTQE